MLTTLSAGQVALPQAGPLRGGVSVGRVVQVALGRRDVAVAHYPLDLVDVERADRLGPNEWRRSWNLKTGRPVRLAALTNRR
jgi:hypothetical protein